MIDALLMPNGVTLGEAGMYELTGYINNINAEQTQVLMEYGSNGHFSNVYDYGVWRNSVDVKSARKTYYMYDGRGSVSGLTGQEGYDVVTYRYDIYGEETQSAATYNPYRYNAEYTDMSTGLQYLRSRYYSPAITRFLSKDPVLGVTTLPYTFNPYLYCLNNAVNYFDPNGMFFKEVFGAVAGAAKGVWNAGKAMFDSDVTVAEGWNSGWQSGKAAGNRVGQKWDDKTEYLIERQVAYEQQVAQAQQMMQPRSLISGGMDQITSNSTGLVENKRTLNTLDDVYDSTLTRYNNASTNEERTALKQHLEAIEEQRRILCEEMSSQKVYIAAGVFEIDSIIPGVGVLADTVNIGLYASQKDWVNMGLSAVSAGLEFAQVAGTLVGAGKMVANAAADALTATGKNLDNIFDASQSSVKNSILSLEDAEDFAFNAIKGRKNADSVVLGKYESGASTSYASVAKDMGAQYFHLDNWEYLESRYSTDEIWKINEKFLDIQTSSGREIYLSHDPTKYVGGNSFYSKGVGYLIENGYKFVKEGDIWHAIR